MNLEYDRRTILLHWASAFLIAALWVAGQTIDFFPRGMPRTSARSLHITGGVLLALLLAVRIAWRLRGGVRLPAAAEGAAGQAAKAGHGLLYLLMASVVLLGLACVWIRGDTWFNVFTVPAFDPANKALRHDAVELHGLLANALLIAAAAHAALAVWHQVVRKDGVLRRMWPGWGPH